tara:strand:+ start:312 stop:554 length:243 start_codon:yes stop_codon:yes gene_type:complete
LLFENVKAYIRGDSALASGRRRKMPLLGAIILFVIFAVNVGLGSAADAAFLSDVGEMLVLSGTAVLFVIAIIIKEAAAKK